GVRRERIEHGSDLEGPLKCDGRSGYQADKNPGDEGSVEPDSRRISVRVHSRGEEPGGRYTLDLSSLSQMIFGGQFCLTNSSLPPGARSTTAAAVTYFSFASNRSLGNPRPAS